MTRTIADIQYDIDECQSDINDLEQRKFKLETKN